MGGASSHLKISNRVSGAKLNQSTQPRYISGHLPEDNITQVDGYC